jgi:cobalamin biosynthesis protein CobT
MNKLILSILSIAVTLFTGIQSAYAEKSAESLDAHVHGLSELTIAMDAKTIELQLISPAMNLVGFEHKASSKQDIAAVKQAELILGQHNSLFLIAGGDCEHLSTSIDSDDLLESDNHHDDHNDHDKHNDHDDHEKHDDHDDHDKHNDHDDHEKHDDHDDHDKHNDHDDHDKHNDHDDHDKHNDHDDHGKHDDHSEHDQGETHSEMVASYSYTCKDTSNLSSIKVALFASFPGIHKINTLWVTPTKQGSNMLSAKNSTINFK